VTYSTVQNICSTAGYDCMFYQAPPFLWGNLQRASFKTALQLLSIYLYQAASPGKVMAQLILEAIINCPVLGQTSHFYMALWCFPLVAQSLFFIRRLKQKICHWCGSLYWSEELSAQKRVRTHFRKMTHHWSSSSSTDQISHATDHLDSKGKKAIFLNSKGSKGL